MKKILVTGCGGAAAANFVASLRAADEDFFIIGTDTNKFHLELADADARYTLPSALEPTGKDSPITSIKANNRDLPK